MKRSLLISFFIIISLNSQAQETFQLRQEVHKYLSQSNSNFNFAMIAEAYRNENRIAFFWPCLMDSVIVEDKIMALAFENENGKWTAFDMFVASNDSNMVQFIKAIGGTDYKIVKPEGVAMDYLGTFMYEKMKSAHKNIVLKQNEAAINEIEEFSRAFGLMSAVFSRSMTGFIMRGAKILEISEIKVSEVKTQNNIGSAMLDVYFPKEASSRPVKLIKIGNGWAIDAIQK